MKETTKNVMLSEGASFAQHDVLFIPPPRSIASSPHHPQLSNSFRIRAISARARSVSKRERVHSERTASRVAGARGRCSLWAWERRGEVDISVIRDRIPAIQLGVLVRLDRRVDPLLPDEGVHIEEIEAQLVTGNVLSGVLSQPEISKLVNVFIPKFKIEFRTEVYQSVINYQMLIIFLMS